MQSLAIDLPDLKRMAWQICLDSHGPVAELLLFAVDSGWVEAGGGRGAIVVFGCPREPGCLCPSWSQAPLVYSELNSGQQDSMGAAPVRKRKNERKKIEIERKKEYIYIYIYIFRESEREKEREREKEPGYNTIYILYIYI